MQARLGLTGLGEAHKLPSDSKVHKGGEPPAYGFGFPTITICFSAINWSQELQGHKKVLRRTSV